MLIAKKILKKILLLCLLITFERCGTINPNATITIYPDDYSYKNISQKVELLFTVRVIDSENKMPLNDYKLKIRVPFAPGCSEGQTQTFLRIWVDGTEYNTCPVVAYTGKDGTLEFKIVVYPPDGQILETEFTVEVFGEGGAYDESTVKFSAET